jgi:hypothetical protein
MSLRHPVCFAVSVAFAAALPAGCTTSARGTSNSSPITSAEWHHATVMGHQFGALPPQGDVTVNVDFQITHIANGGSSAVHEIASPVWLNVVDPLAQSDDRYRATLSNTADYRDSSGSSRYSTDRYSLSLTYADGTRFTGLLGAPAEANGVSQGNELEVYYSDEGIVSPITQSIEIEKLIGDNWVPLKEPLSAGDWFQLTLDPDGRLGE